MYISSVSKKQIPKGEAVRGRDLREGILKLIQKNHPNFTPEDFISISEANQFRRIYITHLVEKEKNEMEDLDKEVMTAIRNNTMLSEIIEDVDSGKENLGDRVADKIASFGGSWKFIIIFFSFLMLWMGINIFILVRKAFDPYPFILLNLILSCLAAIQAPIIMMSQNRQSEKDRKREENDYKVNLKAELEIKLLDEKIDYLIIHQNKKLLEIQELQTDYLENLINNKLKKD